MLGRKFRKKKYYLHELKAILDEKRLNCCIDGELEKVCSDFENIEKANNGIILKRIEGRGSEFAEYFLESIACEWDSSSIENLIHKIKHGNVDLEYGIAKIYLLFKKYHPYRKKGMYADKFARRLERFYRA